MEREMNPPSDLQGDTKPAGELARTRAGPCSVTSLLSNNVMLGLWGTETLDLRNKWELRNFLGERDRR